MTTRLEHLAHQVDQITSEMHKTSAMTEYQLERKLDALVSEYLNYASLDEASSAIQEFIDRLTEIEDQARENG